MHHFAFFDLGFMFTLFGINISIPNFRQYLKNKSNESQFIRIAAFHAGTTMFFHFHNLSIVVQKEDNQTCSCCFFFLTPQRNLSVIAVSV